jgi:hypothetical protein
MPDFRNAGTASLVGAAAVERDFGPMSSWILRRLLSASAMA